MKHVTIKKGREKPLHQRHPWVFSGAIASCDEGTSDGETVAVTDWKGNHIGYGYYNSRSQITVRMMSFGVREIDRGLVRDRILSARQKRTANPLLQHTDAYRLIFSEGDQLPGLIVDYYNGCLVLQVLTLGMERMRDMVIESLLEAVRPACIYERSDHPGRTIEGLDMRSGPVHGSMPQEIKITENGMSFFVDVIHGQKSGFFLDQRENRDLVRAYARDRRVLNLFCYTGGFSVAALSGGAAGIVSVDSSADALSHAKRNVELNHPGASAEFHAADVFSYLRKGIPSCDFIILDPPALAKSRNDVQNACRGYKELNRQAAMKCPAGSLLFTSSCSRFIDADLFQKVVFSAMSDAGRDAVILTKTHHPVDHPVSIYNPESEYLKSLLLYID
jgi:23S rRNA (cytosine1962-C5)-methyltransferase